MSVVSFFVGILAFQVDV